jgi:hypothetical protein
MQRRTMLLLVASAVVTLFACSSGKSSSGDLRALTVDEVATRLAANDGKTFIYDNNPKESWVKGHVPSAKWLDDESVSATDLPADKSATLIFYCHNET